VLNVSHNGELSSVIWHIFRGSLQEKILTYLVTTEITCQNSLPSDTPNLYTVVVICMVKKCQWKDWALIQDFTLKLIFTSESGCIDLNPRRSTCLKRI
jgi:hypothetical protein